ncbi:MAG: 5'-methylthioadenosine/S-adenosylhomocysteine nucleosidase [Acutalibacteraceae bacterium]|nr:5'-methylthioadenosine/S-adenosylhomocysteine nucleosidase [Acutalibacteraceae bacterium]
MKNIGVIVADAGEFEPLIEQLPKSENIGYFGRDCYTFELNGNKIYILLCGIGKVNAAAAAMYLYGKNCEIILNYGYSGGISGVKKGDVVIADSFLEHDFDLVCLGYKPCEKPEQEYIYKADSELCAMLKEICTSAKTGPAVSGDCFVSDNKLRETLKELYSAMSCDMETAAIASVCYQTGMRFAAIRQISDDAGDDASSSYREEAYSGNISPAQCILSLINKL